MTISNEPVQILLIDDDEDEHFIFTDIIRQVNPAIELTCISGPADVNETLLQRLPDFLFLDINMPSWNGFEWLKCIKEKGYRFPVIMYSTSINPDFINRAYSEGAHLYLNKPLEFTDLVQSVRSILDLDWTDPWKIREQCTREGTYKAITHHDMQHFS